MKTIAFFNSRGGVGTTSLVYHLAWMYAELGLGVLVADFDPQASLTAMLLDEARVLGLSPPGSASKTIRGALQPLFDGAEAIADPHVEDVGGIGLLAGELALSNFEDALCQQWPRCCDGDDRALRIVGAFSAMIARAAELRGGVDVVLVDVGPNVGAINRAALLASDHVVIPLASDLYALQGVHVLGARIREWRSGWRERLARAPAALDLPRGEVTPLGYVLMQHAVRLDRPARAHAEWMARIPSAYRRDVLGDTGAEVGITVGQDPHCVATLKHFRSLMALAQEAGKPMFFLKPADGAIGGHAKAVQESYREFRSLAIEIAGRAAIAVP